MVTSEHEIPQLPRVVVLALLAHPAVMVWLTDLLENALTWLKRHSRAPGHLITGGRRPFAEQSRIAGVPFLLFVYSRLLVFLYFFLAVVKFAE